MPPKGVSLAAKCPHCQASFTPSMPKPGRYRVACPRCRAPFALVIPDRPGAAWVARTFSGAPTAVTHRPAVEVEPLPATGSETARHPVETPAPPIRFSRPVRQQPTATTLPRPAPAGSIPAAAHDLTHGPQPAHVPGYVIERILGSGGMGTVYLARQLSLDRPVALKVMSERWSNDPVFVARFTREAYAAALLNHPNVVQIYDIGEAEGCRFFSMEYVRGRSLVDLVKAQGKVDPETAVGYVLQAARGLKHAHDRGMIHRDVKPDNLLLTEQGVIKVADLGLVKTPAMTREADALDKSSGLSTLPPDMTAARMALGTPAYMAPEQCRDAAAVDHRADVYSLGCTLYALVTGQQPFEGATAVELMTKHAYEPLVPPELIAARLPRELSVVIQRMMAKNPDDRYQTMGEVVRTLEQWLGVQQSGSFAPEDNQIVKLERCVGEFNDAPAAVLRARVVTGLIGACLLGAVLMMFARQLGLAFGLAGMVIQGAVAYFVLNGVARKTYLFRRVRQFLFGLTVGDWAVGVATLGLFGVLLWVLGLLWVWAAFGCVGVGLAAALRLGLDRAIDRERRGPIEGCEEVLRRMRRAGVGEDDLRMFVAKYAGRDWEEIFELLFGFEAKLAARAQLRGGSAGQRETFAAWREPVLNLIDRVEKARQQTRERQLLEQVERARLVAVGLNESTAKCRAAAEASALVKQASAIRQGRRVRKPVSEPDLCGMLGDGRSPFADPDRPPSDPLRTVVGLVVGVPVRIVLAAVLLAACGLWAYQTRFGEAAGPLWVPGCPEGWLDWCDSASVGWGGVLLLVSLFFRGHRMAMLTILGAAVVVFGHHYGIRAVEPVRDYQVSWLLGTAFAILGLRLSHR